MGSKHDPSLTWTKDTPAFESRRVRTQPRTRTSMGAPATAAPSGGGRRRMSRTLVAAVVMRGCIFALFSRTSARRDVRGERGHAGSGPREAPRRARRSRGPSVVWYRFGLVCHEHRPATARLLGLRG